MDIIMITTIYCPAPILDIVKCVIEVLEYWINYVIDRSITIAAAAHLSELMSGHNRILISHNGNMSIS